MLTLHANLAGDIYSFLLYVNHQCHEMKCLKHMFTLHLVFTVPTFLNTAFCLYLSMATAAEVTLRFLACVAFWNNYKCPYATMGMYVTIQSPLEKV